MFDVFRWTKCVLVAGRLVAVEDLSRELGDDAVNSWLARRGAWWVEARIPLDNLEYVHERIASPSRIETAREYADRGGEFPPGIATYGGPPCNAFGRAYVWDGNHRTLAAYFRGACAIRMWMPEQDFERLKQDVS